MNLTEALLHALTGESWTHDPADLNELPALLARHGWPRERLSAHVETLRAAGRPWPHPVAADQRSGVGAAQFHAALTEVRRILDLLGTRTPPAAARPLNADERRLLAEVPPHHTASGRIGG